MNASYVLNGCSFQTYNQLCKIAACILLNVVDISNKITLPTCIRTVMYVHWNP